METINNAASAASRAIWGDNSTNTNTTNTEEPISGQTGNTAAGEPYDAGNLDSTTTGKTTSGPHESDIGNKVDPSVDSDRDGSKTVGNNNTDTTSSSDLPDRTNPTTTSSIPGNTASTGPIRPEHDTDKTGVTSAHQPSSAFASDRPTNRDDTSGPGATPSVGAAPESGAQPTTKQQGADKPTTGPSDADEHAAIKGSKETAEKSQEKSDDPEDDSAAGEVSGPGPKVLGSGGSSAKKDDGPQTESQGEGTGEKYVKSSGLKADGGDFDAANPGAGKEADRLLEQKGIKKEGVVGAEKNEVEEKHDVSGSGEGKPSLKEKIKAKLHKN